MKKTDLGTKRQCVECDVKYYDLNRSPIVCPKCGTVFELESSAEPEGKVEKNVESKADETEIQPEGGAEVISLEEADSEQIEDSIPEIEDEENIESEDDTSFMGSDEEDVSEIVTDTEEDSDN